MSSHSFNSPRYPLERGWTRVQLIRDLALGDLTFEDLSSKYGVSKTSITNFLNRHRAEIDEVRAKTSEEYAGYWIASKALRIAEYQQDVDDINVLLSQFWTDTPEGVVFTAGEGQAENLLKMIKAKLSVLRTVSDELGQMPNRSQGTGVQPTVVLSFPGVDSSALT